MTFTDRLFQGLELPEPVREALQINPYKLEQQMREQPSLYATWAFRAAEAKARAERRKQELEATEAVIKARIRALWSGEGRLTEGRLTEALKQDEAYLDAQDAYLTAQADVEVCTKIEYALRMRAEMLVQIGAFQRAEWRQTPP